MSEVSPALRLMKVGGVTSMWKCTVCGEGVDDQFEVCWNCQRQKDGLSAPSDDAAGPITNSEDRLGEQEREDGMLEVKVFGRTSAAKAARPVIDLADRFQKREREDGMLEVKVFGRKLVCSVCENATFRESDAPLNTVGHAVLGADREKSATTYICSQCGFIFWFFAS
jgi:rubrerythrin